jgi:hypothetical protein
MKHECLTKLTNIQKYVLIFNIIISLEIISKVLPSDPSDTEQPQLHMGQEKSKRKKRKIRGGGGGGGGEDE